VIGAVDTLIQGILLGALYALFAAGLSLSFGVMRLVNIAHGDLIVLSSFVALSVVGATGLHPLASLAVVVPLMAALGYALQRGLLNRVLSRDPLPPLLVTFGLSVIVQNALLEAYSADTRRLDAGRLAAASVPLPAGLAVGVLPLVVLGCALATIALLQLLLSSTATGRAFRAASDDPEIVQVVGVSQRHVYALSMAVSMAVVALSGVLLGIGTTFDPSLGPSRLLYAFEAVIIGGMGSLWGTLAGGMILGLAQAIGFRADPGWGILFGHVVFLAVLAIRPAGLFPRTRDA
jgi:branched-chain amino acid transport system permease protein